ncbi:MAG: NRAMP family divalent metal transporter [Candidatus Dormibacterales bacterium]
MRGRPAAGALGAPDLTPEDVARSRDRRRVFEARRRGRRLPLLWLLVGPGVLAMLGENDGPSMLSYAASGSTYGIGFFLPFIALTFVGAMVVQEMAMRVGAVTHRGYGELVFQRFGPVWGWLAAGDLLATNLVTLITEFIAIKVGMGFFGVPTQVAVALGVGLVLASISGGRYWRWERVALTLAAMNLLFIAAALLSRPAPGAVAHAFATWSPLPGGSPATFLLILASDVGATVTPWMIFFQQSAVVDKGMTPRDIPQGRVDTVVGGVVAAAAGCGALIAAAALFSHHALPGGEGGAAFGEALRQVAGLPVGAIFSLGLIEAGALASLTITASTAYAFGEAVSGAHSFNRRIRDAPLFYAFNAGLAAIAAAVVLIPGAPLLAITLNANLLATVLMPAALVFLMLLASDRGLMGNRVNGPLGNLAGALTGVLVGAAGTAYAVVAFASAVSKVAAP